MDSETSILDLNFDCLIHLFKQLSFVDLARCSLATRNFLIAAQMAAKSSCKTVRIASDRVNLIHLNMNKFCNLLEDVVIKLEVEIDSSPNFTTRQTQDSRIRPFISRCRRLTHILLIHFPAPGWMVSDPVILSPSITTASFVVQKDLRWVYGILQRVPDVKNLNLFQKEYSSTTQREGTHHLINWLQQNRRIESIWLPDEFSYGLATIGEQVHTIRIHVVSHSGLDLTSLNNLTKIRIESIDENTGATARAIALLSEFGSSHGSQLTELHLCCDYRVCKLKDILDLFTNLVKLIIVNNTVHSCRYSKEAYVRCVVLEDKLPWPATLTELKCAVFRIRKDTFNALVRRKSLLKLDVYYCILEDLDINFALRRPIDHPTLQLLLAHKYARQTGNNQQHEKYLETSTENVKLLNVYYTEFDIEQGLEIYIIFEGIKEPKYWYCLKNPLNPAVLLDPTTTIS